MKLSIVIPVYNEVNTINEIIEIIKTVDIKKEIIIVDDLSTDGTCEKLKKINDETIKVFYHNINQGKGAALRTGFQHVTGDIVVIQDADLEYDPSEYLTLANYIINGMADVVYGSRFLGGHHRVLFFWHQLGNKLLTTFSNMLTNLNLTDMECCYKMFKASLLNDIKIRSNRFGIEPELTAKFAKLKCVIYEVPVSYNGRLYSEGKKIGWKDGISAIFHIILFHFID